MAISNTRRFLAQGLLAAPGAWFLYEGWRQHTPSEMFFGALVVGGAVALGRRGVVSQLIARGAAWAVLGPTVLAAMAFCLLERTSPPPGVALVIAAAGGALALTRPMLETAEARAAFAPVALRRWFALAASAAVGCGLCAGTVMMEAATATSPGHMMPLLTQLVGLPLLVGSLLASGIGVARMRAWGIVVGALSAVLALGLAATAQHGMPILLALTALPGAMMVGGIAAARTRASAPTPSRVSDLAVSAYGQRIALPPERALDAARVRIDANIDANQEAGEQAMEQPARVSAL